MKSHYAAYNSGANAQNLVFTTGYSQTEQSFILDLEAGSLSEAGQQETEPNLTFMDISGKNFQCSYPIFFQNKSSKSSHQIQYPIPKLQILNFHEFPKVWIIFDKKRGYKNSLFIS